MKKLIQIVVAVAVIASTTGCASTKGYFIDRRNDAADIFTVAAGVGGGAKARIGPVQTGLLMDFPVVWIRGGAFGTIANGRVSSSCDFSFFPDGEWQALLFGQEIFDPNIVSILERHKTVRTEYGDIPFYQYQCTDEYGNDRRYGWYYYTQIEMVVGLVGTVRIGFNPGELLDFLLGWTTIDIFDDDLEARKQKEKSNQPSDRTR